MIECEADVWTCLVPNGDSLLSSCEAVDRQKDSVFEGLNHTYLFVIGLQ